jgi:calcineurin-like phosphoesterase
LIGQVFMKDEYASPFEAFERVLKENPGHDLVLVDFHGEATSEKVAFGLWADGRATAVWGTHTHVPTAVARILPNGTAYLTDVGMVGARYSSLGVEPKGPISHFIGGATTKFEMPESGPVDLNALVVRLDPAAHRALSIELVQMIVD